MLKAMRHMTLSGCAFVSASVLWLSGCDQPMTSPATPSERAVTSPMTAPVMPPNAAENEPTPKATDGVRRPAQASDDQPAPGQNNDHSAPLNPAK